MEKKTIICVVGPSGSGKTTAVEFASKAIGVPVIRSYTTRPMRTDEVNGVDHIFVSDADMPEHDEMLAYTYFGGFHYWATTDQVDKIDKSAILYVIDEVGYKELTSKFADKYDIVLFKIRRDISSTEIDNKRVQRDLERESISDELCWTIVTNNGTIESFLYAFTYSVAELLAQQFTKSLQYGE